MPVFTITSSAASSRSSRVACAARISSACSGLAPSRCQSGADLCLFGAIDDQHAVVGVGAAAFDEQRNHVDLVVAAGRGGAARELFANRRMRDRLQPLALCGIAEHAFAHARAIEPAVCVEDVRAELATSWPSVGDPGATTSRAIWSVSSTGTPSFANSSATALLPLAIPPVSAISRGGALVAIGHAHGCVDA